MCIRRTPGSYGPFILATALAVATASTLSAGGTRERAARGEDVTVTGKLVDLQSYMTGKPVSGDAAKRAAQQCIRSGVPAALETEDGLIVIGMGERGPSRLLVPLVLQTVELKGKLYEKDDLQYIDLTSARAIKDDAEEAEQAESPQAADHAGPEGDEPAEEEAAEEEP